MDGQSYLLLIRDEGGPPELQVGDLSFLWSLPTRPVGGTGGRCVLAEPGVWLPLLAAPGPGPQLLVPAVIVPRLFSSLPGSMQWCLSSAWRMRSASRPSTTTTCGSAATGTQRRCRWCWWAHRVRAAPGLPPHSLQLQAGALVPCSAGPRARGASPVSTSGDPAL